MYAAVLVGSKIVPVSKVSAGEGVAHGEKVCPVRRSLKSPARSVTVGTVERKGWISRKRETS